MRGLVKNYLYYAYSLSMEKFSYFFTKGRGCLIKSIEDTYNDIINNLFKRERYYKNFNKGE